MLTTPIYTDKKEDIFFKKCNNTHNSKYDYSLSKYINNSNNIDIICPIHNTFTQNAGKHSNGSNCPKCAAITRGLNSRGNTPPNKKSQVDYIHECNEKHNSKYDYSLVNYTTNKHKIDIICKEHGKFELIAGAHVTGRGCPKCSTIKRSTSRSIGYDEFIKKSLKVHNSKYDYSLIDPNTVLRSKDKVKIICKDHGIFEQSVGSHIKGTLCFKCGVDKRSNNSRVTFDGFVERSNIIHNSKYGYQDNTFDNVHDKVDIICKEHGKFKQKVNDHMAGHGCLKCSCSVSKPELELLDFIKSIYDGEIITNTRSIIAPMEIDIYLPEIKLAIEFNGVYWHSENSGKKDRKYHLNKTKLCESQGIQLLHIFDNEWILKKEIWKSVIRNKLGLSDKIYARKCEIKEVDQHTAKVFLEDNHLQSYCVSSIRHGLYHNDTLVALMTIGKSRFNKKYKYELLRFCNNINISIVGGASKLLKSFGKISIVSYANRRWSNGNLYEKLGFNMVNISDPNYFYFKHTTKLYSRNKFQKHKLYKILNIFDSNLSEWQNMINNGYDRIWDSGNKVYGING